MMHIAAVQQIHEKLLPGLETLHVSTVLPSAILTLQPSLLASVHHFHLSTQQNRPGHVPHLALTTSIVDGMCISCVPPTQYAWAARAWRVAALCFF